MRKRILLLGVVLMVVGLCASAALALDPMGPPAAGLKKGQFSAGVDYSYSEMKLKFNESHYSGGGTLTPFKSKDFRMNKVYANIGYGITNNLEVFLRLGTADVAFRNNNSDYYNGDYDFAIGFGTKTTFYERDKLKIGGLFQVSWAGSDTEAIMNYSSYQTGDMWSDVAHVDTIEFQFAVGPTYSLTDKVSIYGGPFFHIVDGDVRGEWHNSSTGAYLGDEFYDIDETSTFGAYIGTQVDVTQNTSFNIEYQHTAAANALGMSFIWRL